MQFWVSWPQVFTHLALFTIPGSSPLSKCETRKNQGPLSQVRAVTCRRGPSLGAQSPQGLPIGAQPALPP